MAEQLRPKTWYTKTKWDMQDVFALEALRPLTGRFLPWTSYALAPSSLLTVVNEAAMYGARVIVELGSGISTVFLARYLREAEISDSTLITVDNDATWVATIRRYLDREGLLPYVSIVETDLIHWQAPLSAPPSPADTRWEFQLPTKWYDARSIRRALNGRSIDLLLVDGPQGNRTISRYPALVELSPDLSPYPSVILDDVNRPPEQEILTRWQTVTDFTFTTYPNNSIAVGRR